MTLWNMVIMRMKWDYAAPIWKKTHWWERDEINEILQKSLINSQDGPSLSGNLLIGNVLYILTLWIPKTFWPDVNVKVTFMLISHKNGDRGQCKLINVCVVYSTQSHYRTTEAVVLEEWPLWMEMNEKLAQNTHTVTMTETHTINAKKHVHAITFYFIWNCS